MALTGSEIVIGGTGNIYVAPVGTALPTDESTALNAAFHEIGYTTEDGVTFRDNKDVRETQPWQSFYPIRRSITSRNSELEFSLMQWNSDTVRLAFGGGEVTEPTNGKFKYTPPDPEDVDERALVADIFDGTEIWRIVVPKGMVVSNIESKFTRTDDSVLPITFGVNGVSGTAPWHLLTNSDAMVLAS